MFRLTHTFVAASALCLVAGQASALPPVTGSAMRDAVGATDIIDNVAIYVVEGRRYCFYFDGWHGAGWYRCGYAFRRGLGWGGVYGWQGWEYGPAARRFGSGGVGSSGSSTSIRSGSTVREGASVRERSSVRSGASEGATIQQRSTTGESGRSGASVRGETSGSGAVRSGGAVKGGGSVQGGGETRAAPGGGASVGGGATGGGGAPVGGGGGGGREK